MLQIQRRVIVCLRNVSKERSQANPLVVIIHTTTCQRHSNLVRIGQGSRGKVVETRMLHNISEVARKTKLLCELISQRSCQVIVQPIIIQVRRLNYRTIGSRSAKVVVGKASHIVTSSIAHSSILTIKTLPFKASSIIRIQFVRNVPIVGQVSSQLVFSALIIFRSILVKVIENRVTLVRIKHSHGVATIHRHTLVIHRCVRSIVNVINPLIQAHAQSAAVKFLAQFGGKQHLVNVASVQARHTRLHIIARVSLSLSKGVNHLIVISSVVFHIHQAHR